MRYLDENFPSCPIRNILSRMSDKWSLLILRSLQKNGVMRYKELSTAIPDISQKMLSATLRHLEEDHLINRKMYTEIPPRVEYSLTETGESLMPCIDVMIEWAQGHFSVVVK